MFWRWIREPPYDHFPFFLGPVHHFQHFLQSHFGTIVYFAFFSGIIQKLRIYKRTRINNHIRFLQIFLSPYCDQIRRSRSCSYKMYHTLSFTIINE